MNAKLLLLALSAAAISSCSTAYKTGQTPDDVYYSPVRFEDEQKDDNKKDDDRNVRRYDPDERQIRLGINDHRWRDFDNEISYNPYIYGYNYGYYYNPYYYAYPVYNPIVCTSPNPKITTPRMINLGAYNTTYQNNNTSTVSPKMSSGTNVPVRSYNNKNSSSKLGNILNNVLNNGNSNRSNSDNNSSQNNRSYTPSSSSTSNSSSGSSSSSSGTTTTRPVRNGKG